VYCSRGCDAFSSFMSERTFLRRGYGVLLLILILLLIIFLIIILLLIMLFFGGAVGHLCLSRPLPPRSLITSKPVTTQDRRSANVHVRSSGNYG
jgi:hypothetical protein